MTGLHHCHCPKPEGKIRLCGDYKVTVNQALTLDQYQPEELFATLAMGTNLLNSISNKPIYLQLELDESSRPYRDNQYAPRSLPIYSRLPFGITSAPAIFQRIMEKIRQCIPSVVSYIDDILVTGKSEDNHMENLLLRLEKHGFRPKKEKFTFMAHSVEYLGHRIDREGIRALSHKV